MAKTKDTKEVESIKASSRTRAHLNAPGNQKKTYNSIEELNADAESSYTDYDKEYIKETIEDKANGFDIDDPNSIADFELGYTPLGSTVIVKFLREDSLGSKVILLDSTAKIKKALVIQPGLMVDYLKKGDIVSIRNVRDVRKPLPDSVDHTFNGVKFKEMYYDDCVGIFMTEKEFRKRYNEDIKQRRLAEHA